MTLKLEALEFVRGDFRLGPIDLELPADRRSVLLGPSGCGKTTLLRLIAGLEAPCAGTIRHGAQVFAGPAWQPPQRRSVAMLFQGLALWPHMSARRQVRFTGRCSAAEADEWLARVGLAGMEDRLPGQLSGGEAQRLAIARALAQHPGILLLDEPLRSVDPHLRADLQRLIRALAGRYAHTTIIVTHDRDEALALGEHLVLMHEGKVIEAGPPARLLRQPAHSFTASFLLGAALVALERDGAELSGPFGRFAVPAHINGIGPLFLAVTPHDVVAESGGEATTGPEAPLLEVVQGPEGLLGEVELAGVRVQARLPHPRAPGTRVRLRLVGNPHVVSG